MHIISKVRRHWNCFFKWSGKAYHLMDFRCPLFLMYVKGLDICKHGEDYTPLYQAHPSSQFCSMQFPLKLTILITLCEKWFMTKWSCIQTNRKRFSSHIDQITITSSIFFTSIMERDIWLHLQSLFFWTTQKHFALVTIF